MDRVRVGGVDGLEVRGVVDRVRVGGDGALEVRGVVTPVGVEADGGLEVRGVVALVRGVVAGRGVLTRSGRPDAGAAVRG